MSHHVPLLRSFADIFRKHHLSKSHIEVLQAMEALARVIKGPTFNASYSEIAKVAHLSPRTVIRAIPRLEEIGLIRRKVQDDWRGNNPNIYELVRPGAGRRQSIPAQHAAQLSPLSFPGRKSWLVPTLANWLSAVRPKVFVDAFTGSGTVALAAAQMKLAETVIAIDYDPDVAAFWSTVLHDDGGIGYLCDRAESLPTLGQDIDALIDADPTTKRERAFRRLLISHLRFGGITRHDNVGHRWNNAISRWNVIRIVQRLLAAERLRNRIRFIEADAVDYLADRATDPATALYFDPPYPSCAAGRGQLYATARIDHATLFQAIAKIQGPWLLSYESSSEVEQRCRENRWLFKRLRLKSNLGCESNELLIGRDVENLEIIPSGPLKEVVSEAL